MEPRGGPGGCLLHAAYGPQHMLLEQRAGYLRGALFQLGQRGIYGGAGLRDLAAELGGIGVHGTGSYNHS